MRQRFSRMTLLLLMAFLLVACTARFKTMINADGTGEVSIELGFGESEGSALAGLMGMGADAICQEAFAEFDDLGEVSTSVETRGDETWCVVTIGFESLADLEDLYGEMDAYVETLELTEDTLTYYVELDLSDMGASEIGQITAMLGGMPTFEWQLVAPGSVIESNADTVSGTTLTWELDPGSYETIQAETNVGGSSLLPWLLGAGGLLALVVVVGGVVLLVYTSRKKQ